ncbi:MAG: chitobiase/beta-hexosaminidase C-terminal domain-containing protein [Prevotella sp.]|nr:chitobiase/beta-hexosaminidase C-terminal domain-containing protein [Prevotella sp.]
MYSKTTIQHILSNDLSHGVEHLRTLCLLLLMVVFGGGNVWGQDYSGTYYIKSGSVNKNTDGDYYLCPTKNWYLYKDKNSYENDTDDDDDNGKPFLTTYQCKNGVYDAKKAVWTIVKHPTEENCYYIKQSKTDRYMVSNGKIGSDANRMRVHLESVADADALSALGDLALFEITPHDDHVDIVPHSSEGRNTDTYKYLVVNFKNFNELKGSAGKAGGPSGTYGTNTAGIIGLYNQEENHKWILEETPARPEITNNFDGTFTITAEAGATIYYTIDGTEPTTSSSIYSTPITQTEGMTVIKAIAKAENDFSSSKVATYNLTRCEKPVITVSGNTVTITCATEGAVIHYTTDGTTVTSSSPTYEGPFAKGDILTIRAIATKTGYANSSEATLLPPTEVSSSDEMTDMGGNYILASNFSSNASIGTSENPFSGTIDGNMVTVSGLSHPLVAYANGATIKNVMLKNVHINQSGNVGAITGEAKGYTRIYNCGILPNDNTFSNRVRHSSVTSTDGYCGGLVGLLDDDSRVINCFSYANVNGGTTVGGIVGYNNFASTTKVTDGKYTELKTAVVNCMFYGNITGGTYRYPVYGGMKILNNTATGINNYDFYRAEANLGLVDDSHYNCSWPAKEEYLTKYEFYRYLLNSNRSLCGWWVGAPSAPSGMSTTDVQAVAKDASLMAKWVLDPSIAPYPILKVPGKYYSAINQDPDNRINPVSKAWESRPTSENTITTKAAPDTEGQKLGSITVNINKGGGLIGSDSKNIPITAMDIENNDFCYGKIQLPYYNSIFGNPNSSDWTTRYGGNYKDKVVVGWEITNVTGGTSGTLVKNWQDGYNFADRDCTNKDKERIFAQGGYYYVPNGVTAITITAKWADAIYLDNGADHSYDRVYMSYNTDPNKNIGFHFAPAGFRSSTLENGKPVQTGTIANNIPPGDVYEKAIVLVGNHQYRTGGVNLGTDTKGCTIISADFDLDEEPDYCLVWQLGTGTNRQDICPIRFDFLPVIEMGMAMKEDASTQYYSLGCYLPLGHFEVTETSLIHFGQFEFGKLNRTKDAPLILNGGIYDQYCKGTKAQTNAEDHIDYVILGGNVYMPSFSPGAHVNSGAKYPTRHCAVNVLGGRINNLYLTGNFNNGVTPNKDNPHCYIDGGNFKQIAAAAKEGINGDVYFKINHSVIEEFYGGSTLADKLVTGNINVTVDNSKVTKYCGGPKFGNMTLDANNPANNKTVTTNATGTTFGVYYGGGNGGTSYVQYASTDYTNSNATGNYDWDASDRGNLGGYTPNAYRSGGKNYIANYEMEIVNSSTGTDAKKGIFRTYLYAAQFSATNTGPITNNLTDCKVLTNFYGGGNLGGVIGDVTSTLTDTKVLGSAFGAGYSASVPEVTIYNKDKTAPTLNVYTGIITPTPDPDPNSTSTTYTWCYKNETTNVVIPSGVVIPDGVSTGNPTFEYEGEKYFYTEESLENLGTVTGKVTLNIEGITTVDKSIYGGGEESGVDGDTEVSVSGGTIGAEKKGGVEYGNVYGGGKGKVKDVTAGFVKGNTSVTISQAEGKTTRVYHNVYGGGAYGSVGDFTYDASGMPTACAESTGNTSVTITGGTFGSNGHENGMVFGSSRGDVATPEGTPAVDPNDRMAWVYSTQVNIGTENATTGPTIKGSIYGSGENGHTLQNTVLNINSGTVGIPTGEKITDDNGTPDNKDDDIEYSGANYPYRGNVYGGGCGTDTYNDGTVDKYNPLAGIVKGTTTIYINGGHVVRNVYGAGAMGSVGGGTTTDAGKTTINVTGGRIGYDGNSNNDGCIFGAARGENGISTATSNLANVRETEVNINAHPTDATKSPVIWGSVFGGGEAGTVKEGVAVNMTGGLIHKDIYGGGALADTQTSNWDATGGTWADAQKSALHTTTIRATGGRVVEEIFGGGLGEDGKPAYVWGDVLLDLNGTTPIDGTTHKPSTTGMATTSTTGCVVGQIFGCNNVNGTPKGDVMVHIYATQNAEADKIANTPATGTEGEEGYKPADETQKVKGRYDITAVYGGGNMAAYEPADPDNNKSEVIIDGCQLTSIKTVYGGGNAACTPSTNVTVNGTFEVEELFGGGNGLDDIDVNGVTKPNPGANVGYKNYSEYYQEGGVWKVRDKAEADTKEERLVSSYVYGTGKASVNIFGGTVHRVFGGSNTKGNVRQTAVTLLDENSGCDFCVDEAYGGGKSAEMDAEAKLLMACIPGLEAVYGGAEAADVRGNVTLNITNGTFDRVFGGNNLSGTISGSITVNVEEIGCKPVKIGELYGGGNEAGYSIYGYDSNGKPVESGTTPLYNDPQVNVMSFTSIGNIYGGGYGSGATMVGNPTVNINVAYGRYYNDDESVVGENAKTPNNYPIPSHATGKIGAISNVFGGGNAAKVIGNTTVNVGTLSEVYVVKQVTVGDDVSSLYIRNNNGTYSKASGTAQDGTTYYEKQDVIGADIRGNVYGGGNAAEVTGNTNVTIGKDATN